MKQSGQRNEFLQKQSTFLTPRVNPIKSRGSLRAKSVLDYECHGGTSDLRIMINGPRPFEPTEKRQGCNNSILEFACGLRTSPKKSDFKAATPWNNYISQSKALMKENEI